MKFNLIVVLGPTASGKTRLGVQLARLLDGEIISADSRQVYRGLDLGAGKDLAEYDGIPYHLIDILDPGLEFNLFQFQKCFTDCFQDITTRGKLPLLVGGTGLYLDSVLRNYRLTEVQPDPALHADLQCLPLDLLVERLRSVAPHLHNTTDLLHTERVIRAIEIATRGDEGDTLPIPDLKPFILGIKWERATLRRRITERLRQRLDAGLVEEVECLLKAGVSHETLEFYGLEYRYVGRYLRGEINRNDMFQKLNSAIHDFAKRQETWFRRMEKNGIEQIHWLDGEKDLLLQARTAMEEMGRVALV